MNMKILKLNRTRTKILLLSTGFLLLSCDKDDPIIDLDADSVVVSESDIYITPNEVSFFDQELIQYEIFSSIGIVDEVTVSSGVATQDLEIEELGITDKKTIYEADFSKLGLSAIGDEIKLSVVPSIEGADLKADTVAIAVINPIELAAPEKLVVTDDKVDSLNYEIVSTQVKDAIITLEQKTFFDGVYTEITGDWNSEKDKYTFNPTDFEKLDTVYFKVTASKDALTASKTIKVVIDTEYLGDASELIMSNSNMFYSLEELSGVQDIDSELEFIHNEDAGALAIKVTNPVNLKLVAYPVGDVDKVFAFGDKLETIEVVNNEPEILTIDPVKTGELYAYKITRVIGGEDEVFYGLIKIETIIDGGSGNTVTLSVKEAK